MKGWQFFMTEDHRPKTATTRRDSFVVRIWHERDKPGWQGWVQHADTGESALVHELDDLVVFIEQRIGRPRGTFRRGIK
jgi:hypothetical protein